MVPRPWPLRDNITLSIDQWRRNHGARGGTCLSPPPTLQLRGGTGARPAAATKTSIWRTVILKRNYPDFRRQTWRSSCVHIIFLTLFKQGTIQRIQADYFRQRNDNIQYCCCTQICLLIQVPVSVLTFVKLLNFLLSCTLFKSSVVKKK